MFVKYVPIVLFIYIVVLVVVLFNTSVSGHRTKSKTVEHYTVVNRRNDGSWE